MMKPGKDGTSDLLKRRNRKTLKLENIEQAADNEEKCKTPFEGKQSIFQNSPLIGKAIAKKIGMRSLSNSKLILKEPTTSLPILNSKYSSNKELP
mmetsp:Transcript_16908/g.19549  ORF Transcript_16908/g.19549 Transcript_16908/m.19549 type:complete len:95 (+) Transcript_16908:16-300(+)